MPLSRSSYASRSPKANTKSLVAAYVVQYGIAWKLLNQLSWQPQDVDLYEINEAFAVVSIVAMRELSLDHSQVNVNGGACALGHPFGATGARILTILIHALIS